MTAITLPITEAEMPTGASCSAGLIRACDLPRLMAADDGRGRIVGLRQLAKNWAIAATDQRAAMISVEPRPHRWFHRLTRRRFDLARIAAVVRALCDRDEVPVPTWVGAHRASRAVCLNDRKLTDSRWDAHIREIAPAACAVHNVWFAPVDLDDHRVHGFR
ncbi:hypothetical protein [Candidatus Poriferisodalis sp.]|uniref:hypothetical protein n=1 Tax=Candidatus Poriferisodalis sp. TaxID=3101277 RepID=UPI003B0266D7